MSKESAVIVLHEQSTNSLILTQRTEHLRDHPGEVCFPGGRWERGDRDLWATALRELQEELAINSDRIQLIKKLDIEQTVKGTVIHPWLARIIDLEPYVANSYEVAEVLKFPMSDVLQVSNYKDMVIERFGISITTCQYIASNYFVWGATARIMKKLNTSLSFESEDDR